MASVHPVQSARSQFLTKLFYGSGSLAFGVKDNGFNVLLLLYYNQVLGLPASWAGSALALALVVDSVVDPLIGYASDNTRSRWGRRHPYMYAAAIPASLSYLLLWMPPAHLGNLSLLAYLFVTTVLVRSFITVYEIPSAALGPELNRDYDERTSYMSFRYLFGWVGGVTMYVLAFAVFLRPDATHPVGQLNPHGYHTYAIAAAIVMFVSILSSSIGTHSAIPYLKTPPARPRIPFGQVAREIGGVLGNKSAAVLLGFGIVSGVSAGVTFALQAYFSTFFWQLPAQNIAVLGLGSYVSAFGAMVAAPRLSKRLGKKRALITVAIISAILGPSTLILRLLGFFPENNSAFLVPLMLVMGIVTVGLSIVPPILAASMMSDVVEDNQVKSGRRSEGVLFAANAFLLKCVSGLGLLAGSFVLSMVHFPQGAKPGHVAPEVLSRLALVDICALAVLNAIAIALVAGYTITRAKHAANLETLDATAAELVTQDPRLHVAGPH
ncbi:MFS transporter [Phenylobacterium sp.]|uniref:MFS transporter n=1 Tax=Phenylobacterium sp. TaxID=1871053 RepID=UPI00356A0BF4